MSKVEMKQLVLTAKEMNSTMGLEPKIKVIGISKEELEEAIQLNAEDIRWKAGTDEDGDPYEADNFSEDSLLVLEALGVGNPDKKKASNKKKATKEDKIDEEENEEIIVKTRAEKAAPAKKTTKAEPEPDDDDDDLESRLSSAKKMDELNSIIEDFPEVFTKKIIKGFAELKNPILLKKAMRNAAGIAPKEKEVAPKVKKEKGTEYNRVDAVCEALKQKPKSVEEWAKKADSLMLENGGKANINENKFIIRYIQKMEKHFDFDVKIPME